MSPVIRTAQPDDVLAITRIYNHAILHGTATFETDAVSEAEMQRRMVEKLEAGYPFLVAEEGGELLGYAYGGPFRPRAAYRFTVEDSIYLDPKAFRRGIGKALLSNLIDECRERGFKQMVAVIGDSQNHGSIGLHKAMGFHHVGNMKNTGFKFERFLDTVIMQLEL